MMVMLYLLVYGIVPCATVVMVLDTIKDSMK